jgi:hypothetical protein
MANLQADWYELTLDGTVGEVDGSKISGLLIRWLDRLVSTGTG